MAHQRFNPPDTLPLREALRGLRFVLRRGGETLAETLNVEALPRPASDLAEKVLREVGGLARSVDVLASGVAKTILGEPEASSEALQSLIGRQGAEAVFGAAIYAALTSVLERLGVTSVFVSEAAARTAFSAIQPRDGETPVEERAAELTVRLIEARVIRGPLVQTGARVPDAALEPTGVFAVMLWLQSARSEAENEAALEAATSMAVALGPEILPAFAAKDAARIAALYRKYVPHV